VSDAATIVAPFEGSSTKEDVKRGELELRNRRCSGLAVPWMCQLFCIRPNDANIKNPKPAWEAYRFWNTPAKVAR